MPEDKLEFQAIMDYVHWYSAGPRRLGDVLKEQQDIGQYFDWYKRYRQTVSMSEIFEGTIKVNGCVTGRHYPDDKTINDK